MPLLQNPRWERFAQLYATGTMTLVDAYHRAGFKRHDGNSSKLSRKPEVAARISELQGKQALQSVEAMIYTRANVLNELGKLAFSNMADFVRITPDGQLAVDCSQMTRKKAAAIKKVRTVTRYEYQTGKDGKRRRVPIHETTLELADKRAALVDIGRDLGMFVERHQHDHRVTLEMLVRASYEEPGDEKRALPAPSA